MNEAMKKEYMQPHSWKESVMNVCVICQSPSVTGEGIDAGYGGEDDSGTIIPSGKMRDDEIVEMVNDNSAWEYGLW